LIKNLKLKIENFLNELRALPEKKKIVILWSIVIILGLIMGFFWVKTTIVRVKKMGQEFSNIKIPEIDTSGAPSVNIKNAVNGIISEIRQNTSPTNSNPIK
jgi:hypothetical protein